MIWSSPQWSPASPQLTHGFPRRLIAESHGGFLPGNITVTAKASNLTLRRLAVCDVACLVSRATTAGAGLSRARLLNLRYAAVSYHRGSYCPQYLASAMVEYGVNFATFEALSSTALDALSDSITKGWQQSGEEGDSTDTEGSSSGIEPLISCSFSPAVLREIGKASGYGQSTTETGESASGEAPQAAEEDNDDTTLCTLLAHFSSSSQADCQSSGSEAEDEMSSQAQEATPKALRSRGPGTADAASGKRRRKRKSASSSGSGNASKSARAQTDDSQGTSGNSFIALLVFPQQFCSFVCFSHTNGKSLQHLQIRRW